MTLENAHNDRDASRPQLRYSRIDDVRQEDTLATALHLARRIEDLLEDTRPVTLRDGVQEDRTHSLRMARAMSASLIDELQELVQPKRKTGS